MASGPLVKAICRILAKCDTQEALTIRSKEIGEAYDEGFFTAEQLKVMAAIGKKSRERIAGRYLQDVF